MLNYSPFYDHWVALMTVLMKEKKDVSVTVEGYDIELESVGAKSYEVTVDGDGLGTWGAPEGILNALASYLEEQVDGENDNDIAAAVGTVIVGLLDGYELPDED